MRHADSELRSAPGNHDAPTVSGERAGHGDAPGWTQTVVAICCHGSFWREAVDELLRRADRVCLDLSGYTRKKEGTTYEIQRVVDCFPIERVVFLCDPKTKERFVTDTIYAAWQRMAAGSPNQGSLTRRTNILRTDQLRTTVTVDEHGNQTQRRTRLIAIRRQTRTPAALLQKWLDDLPEDLDQRGELLYTGADPDTVLAEERWPGHSVMGMVMALILAAVAALGVMTAMSEVMPVPLPH